jgi:hypothetical protein
MSNVATKKTTKKTTKKKVKPRPPKGMTDVATDLLHDPDFADLFKEPTLPDERATEPTQHTMEEVEVDRTNGRLRIELIPELKASLLGPQVEPLAKALAEQKQRGWDLFSEDYRARLQSQGARRPENLPPRIVECARQVAFLVDRALLTGNYELLVQMREAVNSTGSVQRPRRGVVLAFETALAFRPNGKVGTQCSGCMRVVLSSQERCKNCGQDETQSVAVQFLRERLPLYHRNLSKLTPVNLVTLLRMGQMKGRRLPKVGPIKLAAEASVFCGAFGDSTIKKAEDTFRKSFPGT